MYRTCKKKNIHTSQTTAEKLTDIKENRESTAEKQRN